MQEGSSHHPACQTHRPNPLILLIRRSEESGVLQKRVTPAPRPSGRPPCSKPWPDATPCSLLTDPGGSGASGLQHTLGHLARGLAWGRAVPASPRTDLPTLSMWHEALLESGMTTVHHASPRAFGDRSRKTRSMTVRLCPRCGIGLFMASRTSAGSTTEMGVSQGSPWASCSRKGSHTRAGC